MVQFDLVLLNSSLSQNKLFGLKNVKILSIAPKSRLKGRIISVFAAKCFGFISASDISESSVNFETLQAPTPEKIFFHFSEVFTEDNVAALDKMTVPNGAEVTFDKGGRNEHVF